FYHAVHQSRGRRWNRIIMAIAPKSRVITRTALERSCNHAPDPVFALQNLTCDFAPLVQSGQRSDFDVGGNLKNAVTARVNNGKPGSSVLFAELVQNVRSRSGLI